MAVEQGAVRPRMGLLCALSMLVMVTALAGILGWSRRTVALGDRISPEGWAISFTPPERWRQSESWSRAGQTIAFREPDRAGRARALLVHRRANPKHLAPEEIALSCLTEWGYQGLAGVFIPPGIRPVLAPFGSMQGAQITDEKVFVSAGVDSRAAYCIGIISSVPLAPGDLRVVERVVDSTMADR